MDTTVERRKRPVDRGLDDRAGGRSVRDALIVFAAVGVMTTTTVSIDSVAERGESGTSSAAIAPSPISGLERGTCDAPVASDGSELDDRLREIGERPRVSAPDAAVFRIDSIEIERNGRHRI